MIGIPHNIEFIDGDIFETSKKTIAISVNLVGVMGKGLALAMKERLPEAYDVYIQLCNKQSLKMGVPYLFRPETTPTVQTYLQLDDRISKLKKKWILFFPTKHDWRDKKSDYLGIKRGLLWLKENYNVERIEEIALPALGCGLGKLPWNENNDLDIKELMVTVLSETSLNCEIYLPHKN